MPRWIATFHEVKTRVREQQQRYWPDGRTAHVLAVIGAIFLALLGLSVIIEVIFTILFWINFFLTQ